jgi:NADPH:quinone reductase-like Zn-dependent oxidoreductase
MRAIRFHTAGDPASVAVEELDPPRPGPGEALVRLHAAAITRGELEWPADRLPAIPSYELSGVVEAVGAGVEDVAAGDEVYALTPFDRDGVAAELAAVPAAVLAPKPESLGHVASAAIPLPALSARQGLFDHGRLAEGERVVIHGATGVVGGIAVQLARWRGAEVVDPAELEGSGGTVDLVFDTGGGERLQRSPALLRPGGRLVSVATEPPRVDGIESVYFVVEPSRPQLVELARLADRGELRPDIDAVFDLADAREAFERSLRRDRRGKIVLRVAGPA